MSFAVSVSSYDTGEDMRFALRRRSDRLFFDFASKAWSAAPAQPLGPAPEEAPPLQRLYTASLPETPAALFPDGDYEALFVSNGGKGGVFGVVNFTMRAGSDATSFPLSGPTKLTLSGMIGALASAPAEQ